VLEVLIVGAGQAGLAMGHALMQHQVPFQLVDAAGEVGQSWSSRWNSLTLFTPAQYDGLPGMPFPAEADTYPTKDETAAYLCAYAQRFELPIRYREPVTSIERVDGTYVATTPSGVIEAKQVVVATGPFQTPFVPPVASGADPTLAQVHSAAYHGPGDLPDGPVLVVGGANSGCQIARELTDTRPVHLAVGERAPPLPQRPLDRDLWWWLRKLGLPRVTIESRLGKRLSARDPVIGEGPRALARHYGIQVRPLVRSLVGATATLADGSTFEPAGIVWATGFRGNYGWIRVPGVLDETGQPVHSRGVTSADGFCFLGLSWQWTRGSALLGWVGDDAGYLAGRIAAFRGG
jgi:putative flavoprotein involved in K+ transport